MQKWLNEVDTEIEMRLTLKSLPWIDYAIIVSIEEGDVLLENRVAVIVVASGSVGMIGVDCFHRPWHI